jgi:LysM repeat protein
MKNFIKILSLVLIVVTTSCTTTKIPSNSKVKNLSYDVKHIVSSTENSYQLYLVKIRTQKELYYIKEFSDGFLVFIPFSTREYVLNSKNKMIEDVTSKIVFILEPKKINEELVTIINTGKFAKKWKPTKASSGEYYLETEENLRYKQPHKIKTNLRELFIILRGNEVYFSDVKDSKDFIDEYNQYLIKNEKGILKLVESKLTLEELNIIHAPKTKKVKKVNSSTYYVVKSGDCLSNIAKKYSKTVSELMKLNNLKSKVIFPGQYLLVKKN